MGDLQNLAAYMIQIAVITAMAEVLLRAIPVAAAGFRYAYWRLVLAAALVGPWLLRSTPAAVRQAVAAPAVAAPPTESIAVLPADAAPLSPLAAVSWVDVLPWIVVAGAALRLMWVGMGMVRLRALRERGVPVSDPIFHEIQQTLGTRAEIRAVPRLAQPVTFGVWRPVVLLPDNLPASSDLCRAVVTHELVHVRRRDWLWVLSEEALRAALWFQPAIWWLTSRIRLAREEFTDHVTVLATGSRRTYMEALLAFSEDGRLDPAPAFARQPGLFHRIVMLSKEAAMSSRRIVLSGMTITALFVAGAWGTSAAFPMLKAPLLIAAGAGADLELTAISRPSPQPPPLEAKATPAPTPPSAARRAPAQTPSQPAPNPVTPENPIPRRLFAAPIPYPIELAGSHYVATLEMAVVLSASGGVESVTGVNVGIGNSDPNRPIGPPDPAAQRRAIDAFVGTAAFAIRQWRYEPPVNAPVQFYVNVVFRPGEDARATQSDTSRLVVGGRAGGSANPATPVERAQSLESSLQRLAIETGGVPPVRVGGQIGPPQQIRKVNPAYPPIAMSARVQGVVILEALIDQQGRVIDARILRSIPLLDQAAIDAVRQWEYTPTMLNGMPVPVIMTVTVQFVLPEQ